MTSGQPCVDPRVRCGPATYPSATPLTRIDWVGLTCLAVLFAALVLPYDRLPLLLVDESRNAMNALGMATSGHWLVPPYAGAPDHWNTKPPLLIWMVAALLRSGLPALLALRLPSMLAAAVTIGLAWWFCRRVAAHRLAAPICGLLILTSSLFLGPHVARSGDYDSLLCCFLLGQAVTFWFAIEMPGPVRMRPLLLCALCVIGAVLTKGIAGVLQLPGLLLFALLSGRLPTLLRDVRVWLLVLGTLAVGLGYYLSRELYDPGYLHAVWLNELGGRFAAVKEQNHGGALFYVKDLARRFEPGLLLLPLAVLPWRGRDPHQRSAVRLCLVTAAVLLVVITAAKTKLYWYAAPIVPLLSIAAALGTADGLARLVANRPRSARRVQPAIVAGAALSVLLLAASGVSVWRNQVWTLRGLQRPENAQFWYGGFLDHLRREHAARAVTVIDEGLPNHQHFVAYNPMLEFYAALEARHGFDVVRDRPGHALASGTDVASCDRELRAWLISRYRLQVRQSNEACLFGQVIARRSMSATEGEP